MPNIIELREITKSYNKANVVNQVSMSINQGEIYGFLGPNGAGKTTIMKMILNLTKPDSGDIKVFGESLQKDSFTYLKEIGSIIEYPVFYEKLTAQKNLKLHCGYMGYYDDARIEEMLHMVGLKGTENKIVKNFSLGMKQRLGLARVMITSPKLLILDEPINGLDPIGIKEIRELLKKINHDYGTTILISSHIITEIEQVADTIGVINEGVLVKEVSMKEIHKKAIQYLEIKVNNVKGAALVLDESFKNLNYKIISEDSIRIYDEIVQTEVSKALVLGGIGILNMIYKNDTLEDYFVNIINGGKTNA